MGASSPASPHSLWCSSLTTQGPVQRQGLSSCTGRQLGRSHGEGPLLPGLPGVLNLSLVWNSRPCLGWEADVPAGSSCASTPEFPSSGLFSLRTLDHQFFLTLCLLQPLVTSVVRTLPRASGHGHGHSAVNGPKSVLLNK